MSEPENAVAGWSVRRQFEHSRLEAELLEAVYDVLLASGPEASPADGSPGPAATTELAAAAI